MSRVDPRPTPRSGIMAIEAYVPGKSTAKGGSKVHKLSSNETPHGPSPLALAAYRTAGEKLDIVHRQPSAPPSGVNAAWPDVGVPSATSTTSTSARPMTKSTLGPGMATMMTAAITKAANSGRSSPLWKRRSVTRPPSVTQASTGPTPRQIRSWTLVVTPSSAQPNELAVLPGPPRLRRLRSAGPSRARG